MMDELDKLANTARREQAPQVSVAPAVMARIREEDALLNRPLAFMAAGSLVAAGVTVSMSLTIIQMLSDPLAALFDVAPILVQ
jgi:hypothetical protein